MKRSIVILTIIFVVGMSLCTQGRAEEAYLQNHTQVISGTGRP